MASPPAELTDALRALGVRAGDVVMVHASMRSVGAVAGGAAGDGEALEAAVGSGGTLLMNLGARDDYDWVNARPAGERGRLLAPAPVFDAASTPADPDVGVLAEVFRQLPGTVVNDHPDARFGARGALARTLLAEPLPWDDYYGPGSALDRFAGAGGRVLRLGAGLDTVTLLHLVEYRVTLPAKRRVTRHHKVSGGDGEPAIRTVSCLNDGEGIVAWDGEDYFAVIVREYLAAGRARTGTVGRARSELMEAGDLLAFAVAWMQANFRP